MGLCSSKPPTQPEPPDAAASRVQTRPLATSVPENLHQQGKTAASSHGKSGLKIETPTPRAVTYAADAAPKRKLDPQSPTQGDTILAQPSLQPEATSPPVQDKDRSSPRSPQEEPKRPQTVLKDAHPDKSAVVLHPQPSSAHHEDIYQTQHIARSTSSSWQEDAVQPHRTESFISPWNLAEAPPAVQLKGRPSLPYPAPFIPQPSLASLHTLPFSQPDSPLDKRWQPRTRRALLVGCNYAAEAAGETAGCALDVYCLADMLLDKFGFEPDHVVILHDDQPHANYLPTRDNILAGAQWLTAGCTAYDSLIFVFCGRAAHVDLAEVLDGDFREGEDEGLLPCDYRREGALASAQLAEVLSSNLVEGARLHCFVDARGSSTFCLPNNTYMRKDGWLDWEEDAIADALAESTTTMMQEKLGRIRGEAWVSPLGAEIVLISSMPEEEDAEGVLSTGAIAFSLIQAVDQGHASTYNKLLRAMRYALKNGPQHFEALPELSSSQMFDLDRTFVL